MYDKKCMILIKKNDDDNGDNRSKPDCFKWP